MKEAAQLSSARQLSLQVAWLIDWLIDWLTVWLMQLSTFKTSDIVNQHQ